MTDAVAAVPAPGEVAVAAAPAQDDGSQPFKHHSGIVPQLQNVVSTVNLGCQLDLASIAQRARNAEYNPKRFAACIVRIREPKTTALMFNSGKMVIAGARSEEASRLAARKYTKILQKLGYQCTFTDFTIQNMVASCSVEFPIRLEGLAAHFDLFVHYEPEVFPGLVFRMANPKVVLLIFVTGKIVITGAKHVTDIYRAFTEIYGVLLDHRKGDARRLVRTTPATPATALAGTAAQGQIAGGAAPITLPGPSAGDGEGLDMLGGLTLPAPTPAAQMPPPTPAAGPSIPPPTPAAGRTLPPPTPAAGPTIPPPTPAAGPTIPPPTPAAGPTIPPPTPAAGRTLPPPTPNAATTLPPPAAAQKPPAATMLPPPAK